MTAAILPATVTCSRAVHWWPFHVKTGTPCLCGQQRWVPRQRRSSR